MKLTAIEKLDALARRQGSCMAFVSDNRFGWGCLRGTTGTISRVYSVVWGWDLRFVVHGRRGIFHSLLRPSDLKYLHIPAIYHIQE